MNNTHGAPGSVNLKEYLKTCSLRVLIENSEMMSLFATAAVSFFSKPNKTSWHLRSWVMHLR